MQILNLQEGETIELKREWTDRALEDLAAFANTHGGILLLAQAFYYAGHIERWGTGTARILALCREQGLPEPEFDADALQFRVRFLKDPYTPNGCVEWDGTSGKSRLYYTCRGTAALATESTRL